MSRKEYVKYFARDKRQPLLWNREGENMDRGRDGIDVWAMQRILEATVGNLEGESWLIRREWDSRLMLRWKGFGGMILRETVWYGVKF
jgi:hypothetical protein